MTVIDSFDQRQLRTVLGTFATGVTIVTTRDAAGKAHGVTANSFSSVSLDPPLVLWSQALTSKSHAAFSSSERFVVNILADDQIEVSNHFAKSQDDKFAGIAHENGLGDVPVIEGTAAHLECVKVATHPGGDHVVYVGRVERIGRSHRRPLAFSGGRYSVAYAHELGLVSLQLGSAKPVSMSALRTAIDAMPGICAEVGDHSLCLSVWGNHGPVAIYWEASRKPVSEHLRVGSVMSATHSASGRLFCAYLPAEITKPFIHEDLKLYRAPAEDEVEQRQRFEIELEVTRERGLSRVVDPPHAHLLHRIPTTAFAAPIFDGSGAMVMAMSMVSPVDRLDPDWLGRAPRLLSAEAGRLTALSR